MRASDLYRGVTRLTAAIESTAASTVGMMIQPLLRTSAWPSARKSRSPDSGAAASLSVAGAAVATAHWTAVFSLPALSAPARQNAKRIAHSRRHYCSLNPGDYTLLRLPPG